MKKKPVRHTRISKKGKPFQAGSGWKAERGLNSKNYSIPKEVMKDQKAGNDTAVADYLSDQFGFCINSLQIKTLPDGTGVAHHVDWDTSDDMEKTQHKKPVRHTRISKKGKPFQAGHGTAKLPKIDTLVQGRNITTEGVPIQDWLTQREQQKKQAKKLYGGQTSTPAKNEGVLGNSSPIFWHRKSSVGQAYPFEVNTYEQDLEAYGGEDQQTLSGNAPIFKVDSATFKTIATTLDDIEDPEIKAHLAWAGIQKDWDNNGPFVVTDGKQVLAVDTQGFEYPRYKAFLPKDREAEVLGTGKAELSPAQWEAFNSRTPQTNNVALGYQALMKEGMTQEEISALTPEEFGRKAVRAMVRHSIDDASKPKNGRVAWTASFTITPNDADLQHVSELIKEGYVEGELVHDDGEGNIERGWWKIGKENLDEADLSDDESILEQIADAVNSGNTSGQAFVSGRDEEEEAMEKAYDMEKGTYNPAWEELKAKAIGATKKFGWNAPEAKAARNAFYHHGGKREIIEEVLGPKPTGGGSIEPVIARGGADEQVPEKVSWEKPKGKYGVGKKKMPIQVKRGGKVITQQRTVGTKAKMPISAKAKKLRDAALKLGMPPSRIPADEREESLKDSSGLPNKAAFQAYERVRKSGVTNMFDVRTVSSLSGLDRNTIMAVMKNYDALMEKYPDVRE